jgi:hypothetical protein
MKRILLSAAAVLLTVPISVSALAQTTGVGFPIGEKSRIHTNLDLGVGFDSNPDRYDEGGDDDVSDWKALIRPGLAVNVPGSSLSFDMRTQLSINQYFGIGTAADTTFGALIGAKLRAGQQDSAVGFQLDEILVRTPATIDDLGSVASDERRFKEWANRLQALLTLRPGGGALEFDVGYFNELSYFDENLPDSGRHGGIFEAKLRFLPKTAVLFHSDISFYDAERDTKKASPYNVTLGLVGQVTPRFSVDVEAGFGDALSWTGDFFSEVAESNTRTFICRVEGTYDLLSSSRITAGFRRQVKPVILLDNYTANTGYARFVLGLGARLALGLYASYEAREYGNPSDASANLLIGDARIDYWFFDFLTAAINYRVLKQDASGETSLTAGVLENYTRHQAMIFAGLRY